LEKLEIGKIFGNRQISGIRENCIRENQIQEKLIAFSKDLHSPEVHQIHLIRTKHFDTT